MKKLWDILVLTLAINFLVVGGIVGWLYQGGRLEREKITAIREVLFPKPPATQPAATQPVADATTQPILRPDELLAKQAGRPASEQVEFIQHAFDAQKVQIDRQLRELEDLRRQVDVAKEQLSRDRSALEEDRKKLAAEQQQATRLQSDKGFQDSLQLYTSMPSKQVKNIFMNLDDDTVKRYLESMQPRSASRIIKEFKTPEEQERIQKVLEKMRQADVSAKG